MSAAVFLDKDGTLVENVPYNVDPARMVLAEGAIKALGQLRDHGFALIVVSNQPGVAEGRFECEALQAVEIRLRELLAAGAIELLDCYWCPHAPSQGWGACDCRKPAPGLILRAARRHGIELSRSWMVGDILDDIEAGARAGCRTVLVDNGSETLWQRSELRTPDAIVASLEQAAQFIIDAEEPSRRSARSSAPLATEG